MLRNADSSCIYENKAISATSLKFELSSEILYEANGAKPNLPGIQTTQEEWSTSQSLQG